MKIQILSDLHIEFAPYQLMDTDADVVILAGDIHLGTKGGEWALENIRDKEVVYVLGNHELYKEATPRIFEKLEKLTRGTNVHVLENESVLVNGVRFLGCILWTDFKLIDQMDQSLAAAKLQMTDYRKIRVSPEYRKIEPSFTAVWHEQSRKWLEKELDRHHGGQIVVVTHHAPSTNSIPAKALADPICASFASDMDGFVASSGAKLWVHGHIHAAFDYFLGDTRVVCNPLGYPDEPRRGFDPALTVEIKQTGIS